MVNLVSNVIKVEKNVSIVSNNFNESFKSKQNKQQQQHSFSNDIRNAS